MHSQVFDVDQVAAIDDSSSAEGAPGDGRWSDVSDQAGGRRGCWTPRRPRSEGDLNRRRAGKLTDLHMANLVDRRLAANNNCGRVMSLQAMAVSDPRAV